MTEIRAVVRQIQQLEIYLNNLVSALTRGELPVNLQPVTQIFDNAIASIPPVLNLQQERFIELYNDLPHLFTAYAIDVTLSEDSFIRQDRDITFYRFTRGNYWIVPTQSEPDRGWLVPNPTKGLAIDRMPSLTASFDRDISPNSSNSTYLLIAPALVQILPIVERLTWKLLERGKLTNTQIQQSATNIPNNIIENLVQKLTNLNARIVQIEQGVAKPESLNALHNKQEQLQSISAKIVEQLATKQQEIVTFTARLNEARDRSIQQEREIAALKLQIASIGNSQGTTTSTPIESQEIVSLKIDLEKLKSECQQRKRQQDKLDRDLTERIQLLVAQNIARIQPALAPQIIETIDAEIINLEPVLQLKGLQNGIAREPMADRILSPFANLYNSGEKAFLRSYMVSTASLRKNNSQLIDLVEDNIGHYWIVPFDRSTHYLVPKTDFPNYDKCFEILALLFDGANNSTNFILFKPAIVTVTKANMPKQWKLEQKGYLDAV
ncbi:hypothetical protein [Chamaesiphon sp.]|uniref:hypothetical protein n=1 Tax=Chamaesiphon sp. TaxID=2814140 RepID=UPI0035943E1E